MLRRSSSMVQTTRPDGSGPRWLGALGHVANLTYSYSAPGDADQMSCTLQLPPTCWTDALNRGRGVNIICRGGVVWSGTLNEPVPAVDGWAISAHGSGTFGT